MSKTNGADPNPETPPSDQGFAAATTETDPGSVEPGAGDPPSSAGQDDPASGDPDNTGEVTVPENLRAEDGTLDSEKALAHFTESETARAALAEKFGDAPTGDDSYDLTDLKDGDGNSIAVDADNPFVKTALPQLKEAGVGGKLVRELVGGYANVLKTQVESVVKEVRDADNAAVQAEIASLGDDSKARINSVVKSLSSVADDAGDDAQALMTADEAKTLLAGVRTKAQFELLERLAESAGPGLEGRSRTPGENASDKDEDLIFGKRN